MISANAAGPPQCDAAPPLTAWRSMRATRARVARGSASTTSSPLPFFTVSEYFGLAVGVPANFDLSLRGLNGGASTGLTTEVSAAIKLRIHLLKPASIEEARAN